MKEASLYTTESGKTVRCNLCVHRCIIADGKRGRCNVRENRAGTLYSLVYGYPVSVASDPIEKKPLYHVLPGTGAFSLATIGCNFTCRFCQNWQISQVAPGDDPSAFARKVAPERIVEQALAAGCKSIAYTYTEPTVYLEYAYDCARLAKDAGLLNILVTNGYMSGEALEMVAPYLDAANVDLKSGRDGFYRNLCNGRLEPVQDTIRSMRQSGIWVEVTTLVIPGYNDSDGELQDIAFFLASVDPYMPWHISRYHPSYDFDDAPVTPVSGLSRAETAGRNAGLSYIYVGNAGQGSRTVCPNCGTLLVERDVFQVLKKDVKEGKCPACGIKADGIY